MTVPIPHVDGVEHSWVDAGGLRVHVAEAGAGDPLVLLHGWPQHWYVWRKLIAPLARSHRVICPDLRGHGWTDAPGSGYEKEQLATDLLALLDALGLERVALMGHDWGGWTGFLACLRAPERFSRYVALNIAHPWLRTSPGTLTTLPRLWYQAVLSTPGLGSTILRRRPGFVETLITGASVRREVWTQAELRAFSAPLREPARANASAQLYRTFLLRELPAVLQGRYAGRRLDVPTLLLFGTGDPVITVSSLAGFEEHGADLHLELVEDCGHFIAEEQPELVAERALAFLG